MNDKKLFCLDCKHLKFFTDNELTEILDTTNLEKSICRLYGKVICEKCDSSNLSLSSSETGVAYFDSRNLRLCKVCNFPISLRRLDVQPYATTCVICSSYEAEEINKKPMIKECPKCFSPLFYFRNISNNSEYINCINYSKNSDVRCSWRIAAFSNEDYLKYQKKVSEELRQLRIQIAIEKNLPLPAIFKDIDIETLSKMVFLEKEEMKKKFSGNQNIVSKISLIFQIINNAKDEYLIIY